MIATRSVIWLCARYELLLAVRSRWLQIFAAVFTGLSLAVPEEPWEQFQGVNHVSTFVRSGVTTGYELATKGWIDIDTATSDQLRTAAAEPCRMSGKPPNIIMVLDEASFDVSVIASCVLPWKA